MLVAAPLTVQAHTGNDAEDGLGEDLSRRLSLGNVISGKFEQSKDHAGLPKPLQSEGQFVFWRGHGVHWATESPVQQATIYRNDKTLQSSGSSGAVRELTGRKERAFRRVLLDVFSFDEAQLSRQFELQWTQGDQHWQLMLRPKNADFEKSSPGSEPQWRGIRRYITYRRCQGLGS